MGEIENVAQKFLSYLRDRIQFSPLESGIVRFRAVRFFS